MKDVSFMHAIMDTKHLKRKKKINKQRKFFSKVKRKHVSIVSIWIFFIQTNNITEQVFPIRLRLILLLIYIIRIIIYAIIEVPLSR